MTNLLEQERQLDIIRKMEGALILPPGFTLSFIEKEIELGALVRAEILPLTDEQIKNRIEYLNRAIGLILRYKVCLINEHYYKKYRK